MLLILFWRLWLPAGDDFGQQMILTQRKGGLRRGHLRQGLRLWQLRAVRGGPRRYREFILAGEVQSGPAGDQQAQVRAGEGQGRHLRGGSSHLLEVIQQQQQVPLAQELQHVIREGAVSGFPQAERLSDGRQDLFWIADGSQGNKTDVVSKGVSDRCGQGQGQACFPDSPGPVSVSRRTDACCNSAASATISRSRPKNE